MPKEDVIQNTFGRWVQGTAHRGTQVGANRIVCGAILQRVPIGSNGSPSLIGALVRIALIVKYGSRDVALVENGLILIGDSKIILRRFCFLERRFSIAKACENLVRWSRCAAQSSDEAKKHDRQITSLSKDER